MDVVELKQWVLSDEFESVWKESFSSLKEIFSDYQGRGKITPKREPKNKYLWLLIETPYPGIHLISFEVPVDLSDLPIYLKVWVDEKSPGMYEKLNKISAPVILEQKTTPFKNQIPTGSFKADLNRREISLRGVLYKVDGQKIITDKSSARSKLQAMGNEFCALILGALAGSQPIRPQKMLVRLMGKQAQRQEFDDASSKLDLDELVENEELVSFIGASETGELIDKDPRFAGVTEKTKVALINARVGQGGYRRRMLKLWGNRCSLTGCDIPQVLIASHSKPWNECCVEQCLNEYNGLLLAASLDRLFDVGLISFSEKGELLMHPTLSSSQWEDMGFSKYNKLRFICKDHQEFLLFHRKKYGYES